VALAGGGEGRPADAGPTPTAPPGPAAGLAVGHVAAVLPVGPASLLVAMGDRVDVYAAQPDGDAVYADRAAAAALVAVAALVLAVVPSTRNQGSAEASGYVVIELSDEEARALAGRADARLTVVVKPRGG
ncbi:MAG: hypothetical protein JWN61_834, partial [Pseudonocardiales bacterium]|nr:hypothetical protein [Pseudonocardiales bacterium]